MTIDGPDIGAKDQQQPSEPDGFWSLAAGYDPLLFASAPRTRASISLMRRETGRDEHGTEVREIGS